MRLGISLNITRQNEVFRLSNLFSRSEPGFTFEPWDMTTLYQDRAGTMPVTAAGQSVGLRLSKDKGLRLGADQAVNGGFTTDLSGWTVPAPTRGTVAWDAGTAKVINDGTGGSQYIQQQATTVAGIYYVIEVEVVAVSGATAPRIGAGTVSGGTDLALSSLGIGEIGKIKAIFKATTTSSFIWLQPNFGTGAGVFAKFDNFTIKTLAGNHEVAINDASRGIYGWMPKTGKRNLLTHTEQFDNAAWAKINGGLGTTPTVTSGFTDPDGGNAAWRLVANSGGSGVSDYSVMRQTLASTDGARSIYIKSNTGASQIIYFGAPISGSALTVTTSWTRVTFNTVTASLFFDIGVFPSNAAGGSGTTADVLIWHPQLEVGSTATAYQRVASQYDVTEAGVASCYYVQTDGVDDAYVTPTITPGTDKVQVFAGVRKLSDAAIATAVSTGASAGSFELFAPRTTTGGVYSMSSRGTSVSEAISVTASFIAPATSVLTGLADISGDVAILRVNGVQDVQSTTDQGTGNYLAYPAYIYARGGTTLPFNGYDFGHAVRFGPNLDAATIARVEALIARNTPEVTL